MAKKDKYLVGLDIGSTKTCVLLAEIEGEQVRFLALGAAESKGLRKGLIVNLDSTVSSIRRAVEEAERHTAAAVHLRPELVVEIALDGVQVSPRYPGGVALRFARVVRYRPDKESAQADTIEAVRALLPGRNRVADADYE